jgi:hypothetical protein
MSDEYAVVELMGYVKFGARVSEVERYGAKMLRAEVCGQRAGEFVAEQLVSGAAIYRLTPVVETRARAMNTPYQLQRALPDGVLDVPADVPRLGTHHADDGDADARCLCGHDRGSHAAGADECCGDDCGCAVFRRAGPGARADCGCGHAATSHTMTTDGRAECNSDGCACMGYLPHGPDVERTITSADPRAPAPCSHCGVAFGTEHVTGCPVDADLPF